ncbi:MAG: hypothetical protein RMY16_07425, partial [Nostoc sp. DedQUE12b]|uniref:hypothetical protein n=1 Tax=Nostoc sp. DedQUE12b TaxID=3075398 RepID=UPI002AD309E3
DEAKRFNDGAKRFKVQPYKLKFHAYLSLSPCLQQNAYYPTFRRSTSFLRRLESRSKRCR